MAEEIDREVSMERDAALRRFISEEMAKNGH